jgi:pyruvate formate lyase activating enzyme
MDDLTCQVIEINRGTTHDGPGMRMTFFLKGCPLSCWWCQNPEGIPARQEIWWEARKCIRCLECVTVCPYGAVTEGKTRIERDRELCRVCGVCVENCPAQATTFTGKEYSLEELLNKALKDREFYRSFGGGVTVSGGEPLAQHRFVAEFFRRLQAEGVHTALDTCGLAPRAALEAVLPHVDAVLFDIKLMDDRLHRQYTGQSNQTILENLLRVAEYIRATNPIRLARGQAPMCLWIRTPLIPGATATEENITAIGQFINTNLGDVAERWEMCAFNPTCKTKYEKLDREWVYTDVPLMRQAQIASLKAAALSAGLPAQRLVVSGLTARE